jgi:hypothetical protein
MRALISVRIKNGDKGGVVPSGESSKGYPTIDEVHHALQLLGLRPPDMPGSDDAEQLKCYLLARAKPILDKMPARTDEEEERKKRSEENIIFVADLADSNTLFMVTSHTQSTIRFRLLNSKIEDLQQGCEELVEYFRDKEKKLANLPFSMVVFGSVSTSMALRSPQ